MTAIALALAASLFWAIGDLLAGLATRRSAALTVTVVSQIAGLAAAALVIVATGRAWPGWHGMLPALLAGIALAVGTVCYLHALSIGTMSVVAPIAATCAVVPILAGLLQGERPSAMQYAGAAAALAGVILVSREPRSRTVVAGTLEVGAVQTEATMATRAVRGAGDARLSILLALLSAVCFGLVLVGFAASARYDAVWPATGARTMSILILGAVFLGRRPAASLPRPAALGAGVAGLSHIIAAVLYALASTRGYLSLVAVLSSLSAVIIVALGHVLLHERLAPHQRWGIAAAIAGVMAIAAG